MVLGGDHFCSNKALHASSLRNTESRDEWVGLVECDKCKVRFVEHEHQSESQTIKLPKTNCKCHPPKCLSVASTPSR